MLPTDLSYVVDDVPCGRCGHPLPKTQIYRVVRDGDEEATVRASRDGTINRIICVHCGLEGWITSPFLYVDRAQQRAVFVTGGIWRHDIVAQERERLLQLALEDTPSEARRSILGHLQEVEYHRQIPAELARTAEEAKLEQAALAAHRSRAGLPPKERLDRLLRDAVEFGALVLEGFEQADEFREIVEQEADRLEPADDGFRAQALRQLRAALAAQFGPRSRSNEKRIELPPREAASERFRGLDVFSALLADQGDTARSATRSEARSAVENLTDARPANDSTMGRAIDLLNHAEFRDAASLAMRALDDARNDGNMADEIQATTIAGIALARGGDATQAIQYLQVALDALSSPPLTAGAATVLAHVLEGLADAEERLGGLPAAAAHYDQAVEIFDRLGRVDGARGNLLRSGNAHLKLGDHAAAENRYRRVIDLSSRNDEDLVRALLNLAGLLSHRLGRPDLTVDLTFSSNPLPESEQRSPEAQHSIGTPSANASMPRAIFRSFLEEGGTGERRLLFETIPRDEAIDLALSAQRIAHESSFVELEMETWGQLASVFLNYQMVQAVRDTLELGQRRRIDLGRTPTMGTLVTISRLWERVAQELLGRGEAEQARDAWRHYVTTCDQIEAHESQARYGSSLTSEVNGLRAVSLEALGQHRTAAVAYRRAMGTFEGTRVHLRDAEHKRQIQRTSMIQFPRAARNLLALRRLSTDTVERDAAAREAFRCGELGRSRILLDTIGAHFMGTEALGEGKPIYPMEIEEIAANLPKHTALLQYSLLPTYPATLGSWAICGIISGSDMPIVLERDLEEVYSAQQDLIEEIRRIERLLVNAWRRGELNADLFEAILGSHLQIDAFLERLGELLVPAELVRSLREGGVTRLVFIPEAYLFDVPFAALRVRWAESVNYLAAAAVETVVAPSGSAFLRMQERDRSSVSARSILCVSDPTADLPGVADWLESTVASQFRGEPFVHLSGPRATVEAVGASAVNRELVLYVGHGTYCSDQPLESGLVLAGQTWTVSDLLERFVGGPLSRCQVFLMLACSGSRVDADTEWQSREHLGFSIALSACGVRSVIGGIWPLWDSFARDFGTRILSDLAQRMSAGSAYQRALASIIAEGGPHGHPYVWGAMRLS